MSASSGNYHDDGTVPGAGLLRVEEEMLAVEFVTREAPGPGRVLPGVEIIGVDGAAVVVS